ncbi:unnamed protein product, partial [Rotaria magnacalcarata]
MRMSFVYDFKFHPSLMAVSYLGFMFQAINIF